MVNGHWSIISVNGQRSLVNHFERFLVDFIMSLTKSPATLLSLTSSGGRSRTFFFESFVGGGGKRMANKKETEREKRGVVGGEGEGGTVAQTGRTQNLLGDGGGGGKGGRGGRGGH